MKVKAALSLWVGLLACQGVGCRSSSARMAGDAATVGDAAALVGDAAAIPTGSCELVPEGFGNEGKEQVRAETVASGLEVPWSLALLPDGDFLVAERPGRVRRVHAGAVL